MWAPCGMTTETFNLTLPIMIYRLWSETIKGNRTLIHWELQQQEQWLNYTKLWAMWLQSREVFAHSARYVPGVQFDCNSSRIWSDTVWRYRTYYPTGSYLSYTNLYCAVDISLLLPLYLTYNFVSLLILRCLYVYA